VIKEVAERLTEAVVEIIEAVGHPVVLGFVQCSGCMDSAGLEVGKSLAEVSMGFDGLGLCMDSVNKDLIGIGVEGLPAVEQNFVEMGLADRIELEVG